MRTLLTCLSLLVLTAATPAADAPFNPGPPPTPGEARLLRFPAIHGKQLVFTYAGDLYTVPSDGGVSRRLTSHEGFEMFAHFSPDGKTLAFTGQYDGNTEVYSMPAEGGTPKRLTWTATLSRDDVSDRMGPNNIVMGWTPDGKNILFRSRMHSFNDFIGQLFLVAATGGVPVQLPLPRGGFASYSPDGKKLAYNRIFREFRTWKRYRGGLADDVWIYDFETKKTENITPGSAASDIFPMWAGDRIYFVSDRDEAVRMNVWVCDLTSKTTRQVTFFKDFDVKFPSLGDDAIVFENGGWIYRLDLETQKVARVPIRILDDQAASRTAVVNVSKNISNYEISPDGKRALFGARGDVFTVPAKTGQTHNLTATPGTHERNAQWSPDGKHIAFVSDATGEDEIHVISPDGKGPTQQLTTDGDTYKYELSWSPDSKKILWSDKKLRLQYVDLATKKVTAVARADTWEIRDAVWSPDSRWIAYSQQERDSLNKVSLYSVEQDKTYAVTDGWYASGSPCFSGDGKYLFFESSRDFNPIYSGTEWNHAYQDMTRIYFVTLSKATPSPFRPRTEEEGAEPSRDSKDPKDPKENKESKDTKDEGKKDGSLKVEPDGLLDRVVDLPIQPANYRNLRSVGNTLYYIRQGSKDAKPAFFLYDLSNRKETSLGSVAGFEISADGKKMLVSQDGKYGIVDLPKGTVTIGEPLDLSGMEVKLDHHQEWAQIYRESWRQMRDFFYDPDLHGVDWKAIRARYEPLLAHVNHRADLTYVIGEMIGELNCGHTYVGGGDMPHPQRVSLGLLGARLERHPSGYYKIAHILRGAPGDTRVRSPLGGVGVDVKEGEFLIAIDGQAVNELTSPYEALVNKAGKVVTLTINAEPRAQGARDVLVQPLGSESELNYQEWVQGNLRKVTEATGGKVGYLHVPDMQTNGLNEFNRQFYPQVRKKALIIDMRGNGGGNVSPMLIERLRREIAMITISRNSIPNVDPSAMVWGPMVCLLNEFSASDGDLFPFRFRQHKLGKLIGKRSWGGVVGIRGTLPLLDGGTLNRPEFSRYDIEGKEWIIEGHGVDPDILVDNDPALEFAGTDEQLDKAIAVILEELKTQEKSIPPVPPTLKK
jgi:tricorn protease